MLQVTVFVTLLTISLTSPVQDQTEHCRDFDIDVDTLKKHGFTDEEAEALIQEDQEATENEDYSWDEAKGYEECEEFMFLKKGDGEGEKDMVNEERRYNIFEDTDEEQYKFDSNKKKGGKYHKGSEKYKYDDDNNDNNDGCPKIKSIDEICKGTDNLSPYSRECPKWEKVSDITACGFGARKMFGGWWIKTPIDITDMRSSRAAFYRFWGYFNGTENDQNVHLKMALPGIKTWLLDENYKLVAANMYFYIPSAFQDNPPAPTDPQVSLQYLNDAVMYHRVFVGNRRDTRTYRDPRIYNRHFEQLWQALEKENIEFYPYMAVTAGFTRPWYGRQRQEVMFVDNADW